MKIQFAEKDRNKILASIQKTMGDRALSEMVKFNLAPGQLDVIISKMGTSTISFAEKETPAGIEYSFSKEKIAFTHKPFKADVTAKIMKVIEQAGGKISN